MSFPPIFLPIILFWVYTSFRYVYTYVSTVTRYAVICTLYLFGTFFSVTINLTEKAIILKACWVRRDNKSPSPPATYPVFLFFSLKFRTSLMERNQNTFHYKCIPYFFSKIKHSPPLPCYRDIGNWKWAPFCKRCFCCVVGGCKQVYRRMVGVFDEFTNCKGSYFLQPHAHFFFKKKEEEDKW